MIRNTTNENLLIKTRGKENAERLRKKIDDVLDNGIKMKVPQPTIQVKIRWYKLKYCIYYRLLKEIKYYVPNATCQKC